MVVAGRPPSGASPSFSGLGGEGRFRTEVARITHDADGADGGGPSWPALRPLLRELVDYDAVWMGRFDVASGHYLPLLEDGDVQALRRLFASDVAAADIRQLGFRQPGWPMMGHQIRAELAELRGWTTYLAPAGFRDGLGVGLRTSEGRHVGYLTLLTYGPAQGLAVAAAMLDAAGTLIGDAVARGADPAAGPLEEP